MRLPDPHPKHHLLHASGFALAAVLTIVAGLLILAVAALLLTTLERQTAETFSHHEQAKLAARAAIEELKSTLSTETSNDDFLVIQSTPSSQVIPDHEPPPYLFIARGQAPATPGGSASFRYIPLFSTDTSPPEGPLAPPEVDPLLPSPQNAAFYQTLPYLDRVRPAWIPILDDKNRMVARYAYWVEDLQSRVDPAIAGNAKADNSDHRRVEWPFPAAGTNDQAENDREPALDQIALFAVDPDADDANQGTVGKSLINQRSLLVSPGSAMAAANLTPPLDRLTAPSNEGGIPGDLADPVQRAIERGLSIATRSYLERPVIPFASGINPSASGTPKLNLNTLLATPRDQAVETIANQIHLALPDFSSRKGGFPDDYLKTLAASILDYADTDSDSTTGTGYRGTDAFPLVSEYVFRSAWNNVYTSGDRKYISLSISIFTELWNMSNQPVSGEAQLSYETNYSFQIPPNPNYVNLGNLGNATHNLTTSDGYHWFPAIQVTLQPNEHRLYRWGTVNFTFDVGPSSTWFPSPLILTGDSYAAGGAGYRMRWNGQMVDQARGGIHRNNSFLRFPSSAKEGRFVNRLTVSGHSYNGGTFINNMGDPRICFYTSAPQDANIYPHNYSPNRRNIREGSIYNSNNHRIYGRVLPSEWPDGGHDAAFGTPNMHSLFGMTATSFRDDHRIEPDDPRFFDQLPSLTNGAKEAPVRLSGAGRFYSPTELGHIHDPIMWRVRTDTINYPGSPWGDVSTTSLSSSEFGGGNSLRIGRPEHPRFDLPGLRASQLLDLFHTSNLPSTMAPNIESPLTGIEGHLNLNTASPQALRMLIAGKLNQDPEIREFASNDHATGNDRFPAINRLDDGPDATEIADTVTQAILESRPFASPSELAHAAIIENGNRIPVFGNPTLFDAYSDPASFPRLQWTDAAAEESFARTWEASTVRSRNFRIWIVGQAVTPTEPSNNNPNVLAETRRVSQIFADPGERKPDGSIDPDHFRALPFYESDF